MKMWGRALLLLSVLFVKDAYAHNDKYDDHFYTTTFKGTNVTWMKMPTDNGLVVTAVLDGVDPKQSVTPEKVQFILWTGETRNNPEKITFEENNADTLRFKKFNANHKSVILIHGFTDTEKEPEFFNTLVPVFLNHGDYNVIGVNWTSLGSIPWYGQAVKNTVFVGSLTAKIIKIFREKPWFHGSPIHIVAHNLGTLVAAVAASQFKSQPIDRITGLDPPYILTNELPDSRKLDKQDARLVEIVHTSGDHIGINEAVGHRDFYPNNGKWPQPGCRYDVSDNCSMRRAYYYYAEAVSKNNSFVAIKCTSYDTYLLGDCSGNPSIPLFNSESEELQGKFYLETNRKSPFSIGWFDLRSLDFFKCNCGGNVFDGMNLVIHCAS